MVVSASFMLAWLRLKSDSVWPAAVFHASHNVFVPGIFDSLIAIPAQLSGTQPNLAQL